MTDKFDPKTHKFGQAILVQNNQCDPRITYPDTVEKDGDMYRIVYDGGGIDWYKDLTRVPSHDLIPRSDVEVLIGALKEFIYETTHLSPMNYDGSHDCRISKLALEQGRKALTDFHAKHGGQ